MIFDMFNGGAPDPMTLYIVNEEERKSELDDIAYYIYKGKLPVVSWSVQVAAKELQYDAPDFTETQYILDNLGR
jgi:hypothetical protein